MSEYTIAGLQTNMSEYTIAGSARIINRPYRHRRRTRHCSICGSGSHDRRTCQDRIREEERDAEILRQERQEWEEELLRRENNAREQRQREQRQRERERREYIERAQQENRERTRLHGRDGGRIVIGPIGPERYNQYIQERRLQTPVTVKKKIELVENFEQDTYLEKNENGDTNCNICLEDININSALVFQCGHGCCNKCAKKIVRGNGNCHQCREPIRKIRICRLIPLDIFNSLNNYMKI